MSQGRIICGDSRKALSLVADESVHLVVTSPPYNVGIDYDAHDDLMPEHEWVDLLTTVFSEAWRTLIPGGRMAVNIVAGAGRSPLLPVGSAVERMLLGLPGAIYRGPIVWYKRGVMSGSAAWGSFDSPSNPVLRGTFEMVYVVSKDRPDRVDRSGRGDLPDREFMKLALDVWEVAPATQRFHEAPFPVELARRLIQFYTWPGDHVLDPFAGSGTTGLAAEHLGRDWTMIELSRRDCRTIQQRTTMFEGVDVVPVEEFT